jgi:hypothetical protein
MLAFLTQFKFGRFLMSHASICACNQSHVGGRPVTHCINIDAFAANKRAAHLPLNTQDLPTCCSCKSGSLSLAKARLGKQRMDALVKVDIWLAAEQIESCTHSVTNLLFCNRIVAPRNQKQLSRVRASAR